jgi:hypothetical protein
VQPFIVQVRSKARARRHNQADPFLFHSLDQEIEETRTQPVGSNVSQNHRVILG